MKPNLATFPKKRKIGGLIDVQAWESATLFQFYLDVGKWVREYEVSIRSRIMDLESRIDIIRIVKLANIELLKEVLGDAE